MSAHIKVTVDGKIHMDGDLGDWTTEPPFIAEQKLAVAAKRDDPWSVPILMMFARSATNSRSVSIEVTTDDNGSYRMDVEYARDVHQGQPMAKRKMHCGNCGGALPDRCECLLWTRTQAAANEHHN